MSRHTFDPREGLIVVPTRLWGPFGVTLARLALETGATTTMINVPVLVLLGYDPALATERTRVTTASGVEYAANIPMNRLTALGREKCDFSVLCHTLPTSATVSGLLGLDFFRGLQLQIDFCGGYIQVS